MFYTLIKQRFLTAQGLIYVIKADKPRGTWLNTRRIRKSRAAGELFTNSLRLVIYEFFECSINIPSGLSAYKSYKTCFLLLLYNNSEDALFFSMT